MKRIISYILSAAVLLTVLSASIGAYASSEISVYLDGNKIDMDTAPRMVNGRTMVPVRSAMEATGANVGWDGSTKTILIHKDTTIVSLTIDDPTMTVTKSNTTYVVGMDAPPCIMDNKTFVAIRYVAEAFNIYVDWDGDRGSVNLTSLYGQAMRDNVISISDFTPPTALSVGSSHIISGAVSADGILDRLNVKVTDKTSGIVEINETRYDINSSSYKLSDIDSKVRFGTLSVGEKLLEITAVTKSESRKTFSYDFKVIRPTGATIDSAAAMLWPVPSSGLITTIFWCSNPFCHSNAGRVNGHAAIDISAQENAAVIAVADGVVKKTGFGSHDNGYTGYGNFIVVDHGNGTTTQYSHLISIYVAEGDIVSAGQIIGGVGSTGNSTGNHLDFNIETNGVRVDPLYYIDIHPQAKCYEECDTPFFNEAMAKRGIVLN